MAETLWLSHTSINDYLRCPRAYFLKNRYRDPKSGRKINLITPALSIGQMVHDVLAELALLPTEDRFTIPLGTRLATLWPKVSAEKGGFFSETEEKEAYLRAETMLKRVAEHPGPLARPCINLKIARKTDLLSIWLDEAAGWKLCGAIDWLEYLPSSDSVHVIDFKTGKHEEVYGSLQLPLYSLLVRELQKRPIHQVSYWYLDKDTTPSEQPLPDLERTDKRVRIIARNIQEAIDSQTFSCPTDGCRDCSPFEKIINNQAILVGKTSSNRDLYALPAENTKM